MAFAKSVSAPVYLPKIYLAVSPLISYVLSSGISMYVTVLLPPDIAIVCVLDLGKAKACTVNEVIIPKPNTIVSNIFFNVVFFMVMLFL